MSTSKLDKQIRKILKSQAGRESLKRQFGIEVQMVKDEKELAEKPIVAILCPTYRAPEPQMQDALSAMVKYTREKNFATVYGGPPVQSSVVHWSRNWLITEQINSGKPWSHVLFIDDDIVVEPDALERLLSHGKDIVAGICTCRKDPPIPNIKFFNEETGDMQQIWEWPEKQLIEVGAAGTGLMLISRRALEQVAQAYFDCYYEKEFYGLAGEKLEVLSKARLAQFEANHLCYWFRFLPAVSQKVEFGEDISFCFMAKRYCDIPIFADGSVLPGHLGSYPFSVRDFIPHRDQCIEQAKREGKYKDSQVHEEILVLD